MENLAPFARMDHEVTASANSGEPAPSPSSSVGDAAVANASTTTLPGTMYSVNLDDDGDASKSTSETSAAPVISPTITSDASQGSAQISEAAAAEVSDTPSESMPSLEPASPTLIPVSTTVVDEGIKDTLPLSPAPAQQTAPAPAPHTPTPAPQTPTAALQTPAAPLATPEPAKSASRSQAADPQVFWEDHNRWIEAVFAQYRVSSVLVDDPVQGARSLINPTPPVTYQVTVTGAESSSVRRRYSEFELLRNWLTTKYIGILIPPIPEKRVLGGSNQEFLKSRAAGLTLFLRGALKNPYLLCDEGTRAFLSNVTNVWDTFKNKAAARVKQLSGQIGMSSPGPAYVDNSSAAAIGSPMFARFLGSSPAPSPASPATNSASPAPSSTAVPVPWNSNGLGSTSEERWRASVTMYDLVLAQALEETDSARRSLAEIDDVLKALVASATKCAAAARSYAESINEFHRDSALAISWTKALFSPLGSWGDAVAVEPVLIEELIVEALAQERGQVQEMRRLLDLHRDLRAQSDKASATVHRLEVERESLDKSGLLDKAARTAAKIPEAQRQVKAWEYQVEFATKALYRGGLSTFVPERTLAVSRVLGQFAVAQSKYQDYMRTIWLGAIAALGLDPNAVQLESREQFESVERGAGSAFRGVFVEASTAQLEASSPSGVGRAI